MILVLTIWIGVTQAQYEEVNEALDLDGAEASGLVIHLAGFDDDKLRLAEVWENEAAYNKFVQTRLTPIIQEMGVESVPDVVAVPLINTFDADGWPYFEL